METQLSQLGKNINENSQGGLGVSNCILASCQYKKIKQIIWHKVVFECPYHRECLPLSLLSWNDKVLLIGPCHTSQLWGKKAKSNH